MICRAVICLGLAMCGAGGMRAQQWTTPTPEELKMTSLPEAPDARAVVLFRDARTDDDNHVRSEYVRIKVLTEAGKDLGDVRIGFDHRSGGAGYEVGEVAGRTIQPDGTVVPFTGKPFEKIYEQGNGYKQAFKVVSLPAVQVGSILEYRYTLRWDDHRYFSPDWDIQSNDLYLRKGHFQWKPTDKTLLNTSRGHEDTTSALVWNDVLPKGVTMQKVRLPNGRMTFEVTVENVPPFNKEEFMPPIQGTAYHVYFYYSPYRTPQDFWKTEGGYWSGEANKFIGNSGFVHETAMATTAGATGEEGKARALYALVQTFENTDFTRTRDKAEDKNAGLKEMRGAEDVLRRKRGSSDQLAMTYVALARAAGLNASLMVVSDRSYQTLNANWLDFSRQLSDDIAIVTYGGADHFMDPGSPFCGFGHLQWNHSMSAGVRQQGKETVMQMTPAEGYKDSGTARVADLKLGEDGHVTGTVSLTFRGSPAVGWRQKALRSDEAEIREDLVKYAQSMLPGGTEAKITTLDGLTGSATPLKVVFAIAGQMGSAAGSRVVLPSDVFVEHATPVFPHTQRDQPVYFHYAHMVQDAMRIVYPPTFTVESAPADDKMLFRQSAAYAQRSKQTANSITVWRDLMLGEIYYPLADYPDLRKFYADFERKDHASIVLKRTAAAASAGVQVPAGE